MTELDPTIVERYAEHLQRKASARVTIFTVFFALIGSILGAVPLFPLKYGVVPHHLGFATLLVGAAAGGYLGYTMGMRRAEGLQLQAQMTLHQLQVERTLVLPPTIAPVVAPAPVVAAPVVAPPVVAAPPVAPPAPAPIPVPVAPVAAPPPAPAPVAAPPPEPAPVPVQPPAPPMYQPPPLVAPEPLVSAAPAQPAPPLTPEPPVAVAPAPPVTHAPVPVPRLVEAAPSAPPLPPVSAERAY